MVINIGHLHQDYLNFSYKNPKNYDVSELEIYKKILLDSNAHKVNYRHNERIKSNRGYKYIHIIKHLMEDTHSGKGLMRVHLDKPNYIYWDDPNELIERLIIKRKKIDDS